jgi:hypothetical protein
VRHARFVGSLVGLTLLTMGAARAQVSYKIQSIAKRGDVIDGSRLNNLGLFTLGGLNDKGDVVFLGESAVSNDLLLRYADGKLTVVARRDGTAGNIAIGELLDEILVANSGHICFTTRSGERDHLIQYAEGQLTPILVAGSTTFGIKWPGDAFTDFPLSMNDAGNLVFALGWHFDPFFPQFQAFFKSFLWDVQAQKLVQLDADKAFAFDGWSFDDVSSELPGSARCAINDRNEVAFFTRLKKSGASDFVQGIVFRTSDGMIQPVVLVGQLLPDGRKVDRTIRPRLDNAGRVVFLARRQGDDQDQITSFSVYEWEKGTIRPVLAIDADAPGGQQFFEIGQVYLNNSNQNVLLIARVKQGDPWGLHLAVAGKATPLFVPGQDLPGGGTLDRIISVTNANNAGQRLVVAAVQSGDTIVDALYRLEADGQLALVLKGGMATDLGKVLSLGGINWYSAPNNRAQIALSVVVEERDTARIRSHVVLLTPIVEQP